MELRHIRVLAIAGCGVAAVLFAIMLFVTLPMLRGYAGGLEPFDVRVGGYTFDQARDLLLALGENGRSFYRYVQVPLDCLFAAGYGVGIAAAVVWLMRAGGDGRPRRRGGGRVMAAIRSVFYGAPLLAAVFDFWENWLVFGMLGQGDGVAFRVVAEASRTTTYKAVFAAIACTSLAFATADFWVRRRRAAKRR